ncbi:MAG: hypothetical protein U0T36_10420 [Saprospiraceae bacterium]
MTIKQLIKLEDKAKEVWVISPTLHYDVNNKDFSELVSVNLNQKTKYKYIVPATKDISKHIDLYKNVCFDRRRSTAKLSNIGRS